MPSNTDKTSKITLKTYVDILTRISNGEITKLDDLEKFESRVVRELLSSGLVSDNEHKAFDGRITFRESIVITPEGIASLESWSAYLKEASLGQKFGDTLLRFLWVIVGALAASIPDLLQLNFT